MGLLNIRWNMSISPELDIIADFLQEGLVKQLQVRRPARTYGGLPKPVSGKFPTPFSAPIASGNLLKNIKVYWTDGIFEGEPELVVEMPDYYFFVDAGRKPGRFPPLNVIDRWAVQKKGLTNIRNEKGQFIPRKSQVFLYARSIAEYGYAGTNFIQKTIDKILPDLENQVGDFASKYLQELIDNNRLIILPQD